MYRHHKGVLGFSILYTVLFVFDGVRWLSFLIPSAIASYLVYVVLALYGFFLFKDRLIQQWNEIRKTKRKFFFEVLKGWLLLFLITILFALLSEILKQVLGLSGQGQNEASIQSAFKEHPLLIAVFACVIGPVVEEVFFRQIFLKYLRKYLSSWLSIFIVGLAFALTHMHSLDLSEWINAIYYLGGGLAFSIIYVKEKENIYYPLVVHMIVNSLSFIILAISSIQ